MYSIFGSWTRHLPLHPLYPRQTSFLCGVLDCSKTRHLPLHLLHPWHTWFLCGVLDCFWDSVDINSTLFSAQFDPALSRPLYCTFSRGQRSSQSSLGQRWANGKSQIGWSAEKWYWILFWPENITILQYGNLNNTFLSSKNSTLQNCTTVVLMFSSFTVFLISAWLNSTRVPNCRNSI